MPAARAHFRGDLRFPSPGGGSRARDADLRRDLRPLETGEDRRVVVADENGAGAEIAVRRRRIVRGRAVQLPQCVNCAPREGETRRRRPPCVRRSLLDRGRGRIDHGEEVHLSVITRGVLERIENAGGPVVQLQPAQRLELAARLVLVRIVARGKVVQMQDHLVLPGGVNAGIDAVEPLLLRAPQLQVDVPCEPAQRTVEGDDALRLQEAAQPRHLRRAQRRRDRGVEPDRLLPLLQCVNADSANPPAGQELHLRRLARQQDRPVYAAKFRNGSAQRSADLARLACDLVGFLLHQVRVRVDPLRRPVLDFNDADARRTDGDEIYLVRLKPVGDRERAVRQQDPGVVAVSRLEAAPDVLERLAFTVVGERPAREGADFHDNDAHSAAPAPGMVSTTTVTRSATGAGLARSLHSIRA